MKTTPSFLLLALLTLSCNFNSLFGAAQPYTLALHTQDGRETLSVDLTKIEFTTHKTFKDLILSSQQPFSTIKVICEKNGNFACHLVPPGWLNDINNKTNFEKRNGKIQEGETKQFFLRQPQIGTKYPTQVASNAYLPQPSIQPIFPLPPQGRYQQFNHGNEILTPIPLPFQHPIQSFVLSPPPSDTSRASSSTTVSSPVTPSASAPDSLELIKQLAEMKEQIEALKRTHIPTKTSSPKETGPQIQQKPTPIPAPRKPKALTQKSPKPRISREEQRKILTQRAELEEAAQKKAVEAEREELQKKLEEAVRKRKEKKSIRVKEEKLRLQSQEQARALKQQQDKQLAIDNAFKQNNYKEALRLLDREDPKNPIIYKKKALCFNLLSMYSHMEKLEKEFNRDHNFALQECLRSGEGNAKDILFNLITTSNFPHEKWNWSMDERIKNHPISIRVRANLILDKKTLGQASAYSCKKKVVQGKRCQHRAAHEILKSTSDTPESAHILLCLMYPPTNDAGYYGCPHAPQLDLTLARQYLTTLQKAQNSSYDAIIKTLNPVITRAEKEKEYAETVKRERQEKEKQSKKQEEFRAAAKAAEEKVKQPSITEEKLAATKTDSYKKTRAKEESTKKEEQNKARSKREAQQKSDALKRRQDATVKKEKAKIKQREEEEKLLEGIAATVKKETEEVSKEVERLFEEDLVKNAQQIVNLTAQANKFNIPTLYKRFQAILHVKSPVDENLVMCNHTLSIMKKAIRENKLTPAQCSFVALQIATHDLYANYQEGWDLLAQAKQKGIINHELCLLQAHFFLKENFKKLNGMPESIVPCSRSLEDHQTCPHSEALNLYKIVVTNLSSKSNLTDIQAEILEQAQLLFAELVAGPTCQSPKKYHTITAIEYANKLSNSQNQSFRNRAEGCTVSLASKEIEQEVKTLSMRNILEGTLTNSPAKTTVLVTKELLRRAEQYISERKLTEARRLLSIEGKESIPALIQVFNGKTETSSSVSVPTALLELKCCRLQIQYLSIDGAKQLTKNVHEIQQRYKTVATWLHNKGIPRGTEAWGVCIINDCENKHEKGCECGYTEAFKEWGKCQSPTIGMLNIQINSINDSQKGEVMSVEARNKQSMLLQKLSDHSNTPKEERNYLEFKSIQMMAPQDEKHKSLQLNRILNLCSHNEVEVKARTWVIDHLFAQDKLDLAFNAIGQISKKELAQNQKKLKEYYKNKLVEIIEKDTQDITQETGIISINRLILYAHHSKYIEKVLPTMTKSIKKLLHSMNDRIKTQAPPFDFGLTMRWFISFPQTLAGFEKSNPPFYFWYKGIEALAQKQFKKAEDFLLEACKQKGGCPQANLALGIIYKEIKKYEKALLHLDNGKEADPVQSAIESAQCHLLSIVQPGETDEQIQKAWDLLEPHGTLGKYYQGNMISRGMCPQKSIKLCKEKGPHNGPCSHSATCEFLIKNALPESLTQQVLAHYYREGMGVEKNRETALAHARESVRLDDYQGNIIELVSCLQQGASEEIEESYKILTTLSKTKPYAAKLLVNLAMKDLQLYRLQEVLGENGILSKDSYTNIEKANLRELLKIKIPEFHTLWETSTDFTEQSALVFSSIIFDLVDIAFGNDQSTLPKSQQVFIQDLQRLQGKDTNITDDHLSKQENTYRANSKDILSKLKDNKFNRKEAQWALAQERLLRPGHSCENLKASILPFLTSDRLQIGGTIETTLSEMIPQYLIILFTMKNLNKIKISTLKVIHDIIQRLGQEGRDITMFKRTLNDILFTTLLKLPRKNILAFTEQEGPLAPFILGLVKENKHPLDIPLAMVLVPELRHFFNKECESNNASKDVTLIETTKEICQHLQAQIEKAPPAAYLVEKWKRRLTDLSNAIARLERVQTTGQPVMPSLLETLDHTIINGTKNEQTALLATLAVQSAPNGRNKQRRTPQEQCFFDKQSHQLNELMTMVNSYQNDYTKFAPTLTLLLLKLDESKYLYSSEKDITGTLFNLIISLVRTEYKAGRAVNALHALKEILTTEVPTERKLDPSIIMNIVEYCKSFFNDNHQKELQGLLLELAFYAREAKEPGDTTLHELAHQFPQWFETIDNSTKFRIEIKNSQTTFNLINTPVKSTPIPATLVKSLSSQKNLMEGTQQERIDLAQELKNLIPLGVTDEDKLTQLINPEEIIASANNYNLGPRVNVVPLVSTLILKLDQLRFFQQDCRYGDVTNILHRLVLSCLASELTKENREDIVLNILLKALNSEKCPEPEILAQFLKPCAPHLPQTTKRKLFVQSLYFYTLSFPTKSAVPALKLLAESFPDSINIQTINKNHEVYALKDCEKINVPNCIEQYKKDNISFRRATAQLFGSFYQDETPTVTMEAFLPLFTVACKKGIRISNDGDQLKETVESAVISNMRSKKHILLALEAWEDVIAKDTSIQIQERFEESYIAKELYQVVKTTYPDVAR